MELERRISILEKENDKNINNEIKNNEESKDKENKETKNEENQEAKKEDINTNNIKKINISKVSLSNEPKNKQNNINMKSTDFTLTEQAKRIQEYKNKFNSLTDRTNGDNSNDVFSSKNNNFNFKGKINDDLKKKIDEYKAKKLKEKQNKLNKKDDDIKIKTNETNNEEKKEENKNEEIKEVLQLKIRIIRKIDWDKEIKLMNLLFLVLIIKM